MNLTISIGRNQGDTPMPQWEWEAFKSSVLRVALDWGPVVQYGEVTGKWEGQKEESFTVTAASHKPAWPWGPGSTVANPIRNQLARLAGAYGQETIAATFANPEFISGTDRWQEFD